MIALLSPAKTLDFDTPAPTKTATQPIMLDDSAELVEALRKMTAPKLGKLMGVSDKLARLNRERYQQWERPFTTSNAKQALFAFKGDVYRGLEAHEMSAADLKFAQQHLRILSGLYGVLRPLDLMQPYRLEMGTRFQNQRGKDLYAFWGGSITDAINKQLRATKSGAVANLASVEYFKSIETNGLDGDLVTPDFLDAKNGKYKVISFYAKRARGIMASWIIQNRVTEPAQLKRFAASGYRWSKELSEPGRPAFVRDEPPNRG